MRQTIERKLPEETTFLRLYDEFRTRVESMLDMPEPTLNLLFRLLRQNQGRLSQRARTREFKDLSEEEARRIEAIYSELFGCPCSGQNKRCVFHLLLIG